MPLPLATLRRLGMNNTEYILYLSEIHAQMFELHITYVPTDYRSLLPFLATRALTAAFQESLSCRLRCRADCRS